MLPLVILIWGFIIYKVVDVFRPDAQVLASGDTIKVKPIQLKEKDTFSLLPIERDPFLGTLLRSKKVNNFNSTKTKKKKQEWPKVDYLGVVSDEKAQSAVYVLQVDGQQLLFKRGETQKELTLIRGNPQEVKLKLKSETKVFELR